MEERDPNLTMKKFMLTTGSRTPTLPLLGEASYSPTNTLTTSPDGRSAKRRSHNSPLVKVGQPVVVFEHNWTSYYKWRGLLITSIAVLLLHWRLSIYRLLYLLGFIPLETDGGERCKLSIHCLGIEVRPSYLMGRYPNTISIPGRVKCPACVCFHALALFSLLACLIAASANWLCYSETQIATSPCVEYVRYCSPSQTTRSCRSKIRI
jgi:hypothetical protein